MTFIPILSLSHQKLRGNEMACFQKSLFSFEEEMTEEDWLRLYAFSIKSKGIRIKDEDPS